MQERVGDRNEENGKRREKSGVVGDQRLWQEEEKRKGAWATNHRLECVQKVGDVIEVGVRDHNREEPRQNPITTLLSQQLAQTTRGVTSTVEQNAAIGYGKEKEEQIRCDAPENGAVLTLEGGNSTSGSEKQQVFCG